MKNKQAIKLLNQAKERCVRFEKLAKQLRKDGKELDANEFWKFMVLEIDQAITTAVEEALGKVKLRKKKIDEFRPYPPVGHLASNDLQIKASKCFGYDEAVNDLDKLLQTLKHKQLK